MTTNSESPVKQIKQAEDLLATGGKFYAMGAEHWCDTALDSWKLVPGTGYVRQVEPGERETDA